MIRIEPHPACPPLWTAYGSCDLCGAPFLIAPPLHTSPDEVSARVYLHMRQAGWVPGPPPESLYAHHACPACAANLAPGG